MRPGQVRPGIRAGIGSYMAVVESFNEAGAGSPRNTDVPNACESKANDASMRPGQVRPGIRRRRESGTLRSEPGFNEAGAGSPRNTRPGVESVGGLPAGFNEAGAGSPRNTVVDGVSEYPDTGASMRPGQVRPGIHINKIRPNASRCRASMRPGQVRPGIRWPLRLPARQPVQASMRPGQVRPGIREMTDVSRVESTARLQ